MGPQLATGQAPGQLNALGQAAFGGTTIPANVRGLHTGALQSTPTCWPCKLYPPPNADPTTTDGYNYVQSEVFDQKTGSGPFARRLQHQRQYQVVRSLQLPARNPTVPRWPVVAQWRPGSLSDAGRGQEQVRFMAGTLTHVFSPTMTNETVFALHVRGLPERILGSAGGRPQQSGLWLHRRLSTMESSRFLRLASLAPVKRPSYSIPAASKMAELPRPVRQQVHAQR